MDSHYPEVTSEPAKQRIAAALKREEERKKAEARAKRLKADFARVASTEAGRNVFRWLAEQCGVFKPSVVAHPDTGEIFTNSTVYNESRRGLYLTMRGYIPAKQRIAIEYNPENEEMDNDVDE